MKKNAHFYIKFSNALALNLLKGFFERSKKKYYFFLCFTCAIYADNTTTLHHYLWANYKHFSGKKEQARDWYKQLFSTKPSPYTYKGYLNFLYDTQQFTIITALIPSLNKKFEKDEEIQLLFVNALEKTNRTKEADNHIIKLSQLFKTNSEITFRATHTYMRRKEPENALLTIEYFLNNTPRQPHNFVFYFLKTQIYLQLSKFTEALHNIKTCLELHPQFDKGWLLCASLSEKEGKIDEALAGYANFLELSPHNPVIEKHLCSLTLKYKSMHNNPVLLSNKISIENALILFKQQKYPQALIHIDSCIQLSPHDVECKLLKLQILSTMKKFDQLISTLTEWITEDPNNIVWPQTLYVLTYNGMPRTTAITTLQTFAQSNKSNPWINLYCSDLCMRESQIEQAINCLTNALQCKLDTQLRAKTLYQLALLHYEQGNHQAMLANLEHAYELNKNSAHVNNALAYYWATKGKDCTKARQFIATSLHADSSNPYFLDTHALILYKEKKYHEAQKILESIEHHHNGTMLLHLAKVHYSLNNKETADSLTKKAQTIVKNCHEKKALNKMELLLARK